MNKKTVWQIMGVGVVVIVLLFGTSAITDRGDNSGELVQEASQTQTAVVTIEGLYTNKSVEFSSPETVLGLLQQLDGENKDVQLVTEEYSGLGTLVQSISEKTNGTDGKYWQYEVNGIMPQIGADKLEVEGGDSIEWYFDRILNFSHL